MSKIALITGANKGIGLETARQLARDHGFTVLLGARKLEQFEDNLKCLDVTISPEQHATLDEISAIEAGFPHDFGDMLRPQLLGGKTELLDGGLRG